ncbi:MAG: LamG domain-containing protein, partial [Phycisphaerales bacterium]
VLPVGEWAHVAVTFDGTTCMLYLDGEQRSSRSFTFASDSEAALVFGCCMAGGVDPFNGALDDIRLYDYTLSGEEIVQLVCTNPPPGDADGDCEIDFIDLAILVSNWLRCDLPAQELCGQ